MHDYIIIGQGLAGTILSYHLLNQGKKVIVLNHYNPKCSSYIAGGIFSPITGQRVAKIGNCEQVIPYAHIFYKELEQLLNAQFFHVKPYIKLNVSEKITQYTAIRLADPTYQQLLTPFEHKLDQRTIKGVAIKQAGYLDIAVMLDAYRAYLNEQGCYQEEQFDESHLVVHNDSVVYKNIKAKRIIFCNGLDAKNNSFFSHLNFNPTKGELITIRMNKHMDNIISGKVFLLPIGNNLFHVGATYERNSKNDEPTQEGRNWLIKREFGINRLAS
jgi:glycine/D-amino acid oxidase-like deaminating enzyme